jgi:hypothetical protein
MYKSGKRRTKGKRASYAKSKVAKVVRSLAEKKYVELNSVAVTPLTTGINVWVIPPQITLGTTAAQRNGNAVRFTSLTFSGMFQPGSTWVTNNPRGEVVRLMVVWDRQCNGIIFTYDQIFNSSIAGFMVHALRQSEQLERFKVLFDQKYQILPSIIGGCCFDVSVPLTKTGETSYITNLATVADLRNNNIVVCAFTERSNNATDLQMVFSGRARFVDM